VKALRARLDSDEVSPESSELITELRAESERERQAATAEKWALEVRKQAHPLITIAETVSVQIIA